MSVSAPTSTPTPAPGGLFAPLRVRSFQLLWVGGGASMLADQLSIVALAWLALQLTGAPLVAGATLAVASVPRTALTLIGGTFADRVGGQRLAVASSVARVAAMGMLATLVVARIVQLWELYALSFVFGVADAFYAPARGTLMQRTIAPDQFDPANSLYGVTGALTSLAGPALAGVLIARAGTGSALAGDAICFVFVAITTAGMRLLPLPDAPAGEPTTVLGDMVAGLRYLVRDPVLRSLMILVAVMNFAAAGPVDVGLATLARTRLGGPTGLGVMLGAFGGGSLIGSLAAGLRPSRRVSVRLFGTALLIGVLMPVLGVVPNVQIAVLIMGVMGVGGGLVSVGASAWLMRRTEPRMMGRISGMLGLASAGVVPLSLSGAGAVAQLSVPLLFVLSGILLVAAGVVGFSSRTVRAA